MSVPAAKKMKTELTTSPASHWTSELKEVIQNIEPLGSFVHQNQLTNLPHMTPHVTLDGIGRLGFPLFNMAVNALIAASTKAPYGRLDKTLFNTEVRDAWQIDAAMVTVGGGDVWTSYFKKVVRDHCFHLGISKERFERLGIQANLYKMLIYEEGGHFLTHRDTEKEVNMFGTLVFQLPTSEGFTGGEFTVTHQGATKTLDMSTGSESEFSMVSFYADCEHELHSITSGKRVCLVYNLVATSAELASVPSHNINIDTEKKLRSIANDWNTNDKQNILKIGHQLEHKYSHQSIGVSTLKRRDEIIFVTLQNAKNSSGAPLFRVSLLLMERYHNYYGDECMDECTKTLACITKSDDDGPYIKLQLERTSGMPAFPRDLRNKKGSDDDEDSNASGKSGTSSGTNETDTSGSVDRDWNMVCCSKSGWWYMEGSKYDCADDDIKDRHDTGNDDEENEDFHDVPSNEQMFFTPYETRTCEHSYTGNDGGQEETWYYAAAIVISLY